MLGCETSTDISSSRAGHTTHLLGRMGGLVTRLARNDDEVKAAQALRYRVFCEDMGAAVSETNRALNIDADEFDHHCDHLLVVDESEGRNQIVGTYRLLLDKRARAANGFYSQNEFDLRPLLDGNASQTFMELGRSCILPEYRSKRTMELLWAGTWAYAVQNGVDIMFGCASFEGTDPSKFRHALSWLGLHAALDSHEDCQAVAPQSGIKLLENCDGLGETGDLANLSHKSEKAQDRRALAALPPLLKGYLRLGAKVASQAVIDHQFGTTDVLVVLKVRDINPRYISHYGADASRYAA